MSDIAIKVEGLGKRYRLGQRASYRRLTESLTNMANAPFRALRRRFTGSTEQKSGQELQNDGTFWALNDVSFEIKQGEVVGIIGRNGAGKSTLLKILSRITEPTNGNAWLHGRVGSLLEVGTGFHPELTGRENIFLNGAILGMKRREIAIKFDEIVAFSEVTKFLDTPVKHYSSGMYMRLAFAVAAHLEPEILIIDEVLTVGDAQFQKKCLGKISEVGKEGRTVLFVSHNMEAVSNLCTKGIVLENGSIALAGNANEAVDHYNQTMADRYLSVGHCVQRGGSGGARITLVSFCDENMTTLLQVPSNAPAYLYLEAQLDETLQNGKVLSVSFAIDSVDGRRMFTTASTWTETQIVSSGKLLAVGCQLAYIPFVPGRYLLSASISFLGDTLDCVIHCGDFVVTEGMANLYANRSKDHGYISIPSKFSNPHSKNDKHNIS